MKRTRKILTLVIVINILFSICPNLITVTFAAPPPLNVYVDSYSDGTLTFHWDTVSNPKSTSITYHDPKDGLHTETPTTNSHTLTGLQNDYAYDICVSIIDSSDVEHKGYLYFIPSISLYATPVKTDYEVLESGSESGNHPKIKLSWNVPMVWVESEDKFDFIDSPAAITEMQNKTGQPISTVNYRISISTDSTNLNQLSAVIVNCTGAETYEDYVSGNAGIKSSVGYTKTIDSVTGEVYSETLNLDLVGAVDPSMLPAPSGTELPHKDILPGTVYYMNVKPVFKDSGTPPNELPGITVGNVGSSIAGSVPYTYTPVRFRLTRDAANNIYAQVYRINQGSLDLPGLYYEIQSNTINDPNNGWQTKGKMNDKFFPDGSTYAITIISGMDINSQFYYRVVVRTESSQYNSLESSIMPYTLSVDMSTPPIPTGIAVVNRALVTDAGYPEKSTDVTLSWDKPANWDEIKNNTDPDKDIYFNIAINVSQTEDLTSQPALVSNGKSYGNFPLKYRLVRSINARLINAAIQNNDGNEADKVFWEDANRLYYKLKGFNLFTIDDINYDGTETTYNQKDLPDNLKPESNYPTFLLPNKVYYLQMYTTEKEPAAPDAVSNKSVTASFTTLSGIEMDVPLIKNFRVNKNDADITADENNNQVISNYIELQFEKVTVDWTNYTAKHDAEDAVYYDLYMSTDTVSDHFVKIGSTQGTTGDISFTGLEAGSNIIKATIRNFSPGNTEAYSVFGTKLRPNTAYYFVVKTRLYLKNEIPPADNKTSIPTAILSVTTVNGPVSPPDSTSKKPLAPTDFAIATDSAGNLMLTGSSVTFSWKRQETNVVYKLICSTNRVEVDTPLSSLQDDPIYQNFLSTFNEIVLDPAAATLPENFTYDPVTKLCTYTIDRWLFPNRLYYFSLRAEVRQGNTVQNYSAWVSIPVTTSLLDAPALLQPVNDAQLGVFWTDNSFNIKPEDFKIYLKGPNDSDYRILSRNQFTVVKDGPAFYGRIMNLKPNSSYSVRVFKGDTGLELVQEYTGLHTRDAFHQIDVKWRGLPVDMYSSYELAIKTDTDNDYTVLESTDLEKFLDKDGRIMPYYIEKTPQTAGTTYSFYCARIKSIPVKQPDGTIVHRLLNSNTKYYIKVRYVKVSPTDATLIAYSKYIGPVDTRTEFSQEDYDDNEQDTNNEATFTDKIKKLEENLCWRMYISNSSVNKVLVKGDRLLNILQNNGNYPYVLDISGIAPNASTDIVYMPLSIVQQLDSGNKSMIIKTSTAEYTFRPGMLDMQNTSEIAYLKGKSGVNDIFLKFVISRSDNAYPALPQGNKAMSKINGFEVLAVGSTKTDSQLRDLINDKLYNSQTGLVKQYIDVLLDPDNSNGSGTPQQIEEYINSLVENIEYQLSDFIGTTVEGSGLNPGMAVETRGVIAFKQPVRVKLFYGQGGGLKTPYVLYNGSGSWQKLSSNILNGTNAVSFDVSKTGKYVVLAPQNPASDIPDGHWAKDYIDRFMSRYDLSDVFAGINASFNPDSSVSVKEIVLLYEKVLGKTAENAGLDIKQRASKLGLDGIISTGNQAREITRQENAAVLVKLYAAKLGLDAGSLKPRRTIYIKDEKDVDSLYYKPVTVSIDIGAMSLDGSGNFLPRAVINRAELVCSFVKLLQVIGEM